MRRERSFLLFFFPEVDGWVFNRPRPIGTLSIRPCGRNVLCFPEGPKGHVSQHSICAQHNSKPRPEMGDLTMKNLL